ncbi:hypothetical protein BD310DRAFT_828057 [Dichomitus squalens]|uniref:Uncharacterized protein n=1 Tax=Dichomitus squalens TaxID=114155 RepID=A0A4Q9PJZ0_9APHY|nr:hypothetical protein BD310DRAFT_828057 [Dichomitus squalens]
MRSLHLDIPDVAYGAPQLPAVVRSLVGDMARNYRVAPVDAAKIQYLRAPMEKMFRYAVNLVDLDFPALEDFPGVLSAATFRLRVLSTTGTGFGVLHAWENWPVLNSDFDRFCLYTPLRKLRTLRTLDLDLKGIWCSARSLYPAFSQYHITHLTLRGAADRSLAHDLLPIVGDRLVSFRLILASRDDTFEPSMDLWPTQILGDARLPLLKYLELDEFAHVYHSLLNSTIHRQHMTFLVQGAGEDAQVTGLEKGVKHGRVHTLAPSQMTSTAVKGDASDKVLHESIGRVMRRKNRQKRAVSVPPTIDRVGALECDDKLSLCCTDARFWSMRMRQVPLVFDGETLSGPSMSEDGELPTWKKCD